jgi:hypothetical protein
LVEKLNPLEKDEQVIIALERKRRAILKKERKSQRNSLRNTGKKTAQTPRSRPGRPGRAKYTNTKNTPYSRQQQSYRQSNQKSSRRQQMTEEVMVEEINPRDFSGRQPFGVKPSQPKMKPPRERRLNSKPRNSRSISRKSSSKRLSQKRNIKRRTSSKNRIATSKNNKVVEDIEADFDDSKSLSYAETESSDAFSYKKREHPEITFDRWSQNSDCLSIYSEHSISVTKQSVMDTQIEDLIDFNEETMSQIRDRSRSRDIRGHKLDSNLRRVTFLNGVDAPYNAPSQYVESDVESDLDVDWDKIESNIDNKKLYSLNKRNKYATYNSKDQKKLSKQYKKAIEQQRERKIFGKMSKKALEKINIHNMSIIFAEDKENVNRRANFTDIKQGLATGDLKYTDLTFDASVLDHIEGDYENVAPAKKTKKSKSRSKNRPSMRRRSTSRRNSKQVQRVVKLR